MDTNIQKYMSFVKTVEYGSFTKAAEKLHYSQSGISRMIGDLEKEWKVVLLERGKSGIKLTSDGLKLPRYRIREITNAGGRTQRPAIRAHTHRDVFKRGHALAPQHHPGVSKGLS